MSEFEWNNLYNRLLADYETRGSQIQKLEARIKESRSKEICI